MDKKIACTLCFHHCNLSEGQIGFCGARTNSGGVIRSLNYGKITSIALDPIEKKPLAHFMPSSRILSVGSFGCNFKCPFCQNSEISMAYEDSKQSQLVYKLYSGESVTIPFRTMESAEILETAKKYVPHGNIGVAYTYNEPLIGFEFVRDTTKLVHEAGLKNVLVTNGSTGTDALEEILPYIDAMNIDLKAFTASFYTDFIKGDLGAVKNFITRAAESCHVEITTLVIPGKNDSPVEMENIASFIASLKNGRSIPLHITRFFPPYKLADLPPTPVKALYNLAEIAQRKLDFVHLGNVW